MIDNGIITLLPILVVIILAIKTRKFIFPLLMGSFTSYIILDKKHFIDSWLHSIYTVMSDKNVILIILICGLFGSFNNLLEKSGGFKGFAHIASSYANSYKKSLLITYLLGLFIFMDDYLNNLTVPAAIKNITDRFNVPRELLAYIVNSLAASICVIIPFSTWSVFFSNLLYKNHLIDSKTIFSSYVQCIPFIFYPWITITITLLMIIGLIPLVGPMKRAYNRSQHIGQVFPESITLFPDLTISRMDKMIITDEIVVSKEYDINDPTGRFINFIIPIFILFVVTAATEINLLKGLLAAILTCFVLFHYQKIMNFDEFNSVIWEGFKSMLFAIILVIVSFIFKNSCDELGLIPYIITLIKPFMHSAVIPAVTFAAMSACAFFTGSFWGLSAIMLPIAIPLANAIGANVLLTAGAVFSGAVFGSQACFFSDALILSARATEIEPLDQALTQLPFVLLSASLTIIAYLIAGLIF